MRGVRLQIDYFKPELLLEERRFRHTILVFGKGVTRIGRFGPFEGPGILIVPIGGNERTSASSSVKKAVRAGMKHIRTVTEGRLPRRRILAAVPLAAQGLNDGATFRIIVQ
jgi:hypothetical protein